MISAFAIHGSQHTSIGRLIGLFAGSTAGGLNIVAQQGQVG
jgi:hypothetical protein